MGTLNRTFSSYNGNNFSKGDCHKFSRIRVRKCGDCQDVMYRTKWLKLKRKWRGKRKKKKEKRRRIILVGINIFMVSENIDGLFT